MTPADQPVLRDADIEERDATAGTNHATELGKERRQVDEVAQGEPTRHAVDRRVGHREAEDVGLDPRSAAAIRGEHAEAEVDRDRTVAGAGIPGCGRTGSG